MEQVTAPGGGSQFGVLQGTGPENGILVLDDDQFIQTLVIGMLEHLGYPATACGSGEEAVSLYRSAYDSGSPYLAAIMDLEIPGGMGGIEAAQQILAFDPAARLIVSSGNRSHPVIEGYRDFGFCYCMPKPYGIAELTRMLSDCIGCR